MEKKYKRSDFNLKLEDYIKELDRELTMRRAVYAQKVKQRKLTEYTANKRYLILLEIKELLELADKRVKGFSDLRKLVDDYEIKKQQSEFQFPKFPN